MAYYFYFSQYVYLKEWQADPDIEQRVEIALKKDGHKACQMLLRKELARCELRTYARDSQLQIYFVRFGEGSKSSKKIPIFSAFE